MTEWTSIERPSYFGKKRDSIHASYDTQYGNGNWRIAWKVGDNILEFNEAIVLYEDAYFLYIKDHSMLDDLENKTKEVWDNDQSNIQCGLDYNKQENNSNHYQDIAVRRVMFRLGKKFKGDELVQIRHNSESLVGMMLSPGRVPFHLPKLIEEPIKKGWWNPNTVECFWQSNKILQIR